MSAWVRRHDFANLFCLPIISIMDILYILFSDGDDLFFWVLYITFFAYLILDIIWILVKPNSVGSPVFVLIHHLICAIAWPLQLLEPKFSYWISLALLVEINTFFITARRYYHKYIILDIFFWITWILFRLIMYPYIIYNFISIYQNYSILKETNINVALIPLFVFIFLTCLNFKWTFDLIKKTCLQKYKSDNIHQKHYL